VAKRAIIRVGLRDHTICCVCHDVGKGGSELSFAMESNGVESPSWPSLFFCDPCYALLDAAVNESMDLGGADLSRVVEDSE